MLTVVEPVLCFGRLILKRHHILSASYHATFKTYKENKQAIAKIDKKVELIDKAIAEREEPSTDIQSPPPPDEEQINPRDPNNRIDLRRIPKKKMVTPQAIHYLNKSELIFLSLESKPKNIETFKKACNIYLDKEGLYRRGHVEFIHTALAKMKEFNLSVDMKAYKVLWGVFPKERMKPRSFWEAEFRRYPKQQDCAIDVLDQMERNGVIPDVHFHAMVKSVFGKYSHVTRKLQRMMYWLPKFKYANPWPIPRVLPDDRIELAKMALRRMAFDVNNELSVWKTSEKEEDPLEDTFIVSAQAPDQKDIISRLPTKKAVFVDGGYTVYLRSVKQTYFVLRADPEPEINEKKNEEDNDEDLFEFKTVFEEENPTSLVTKKSVHEQEDATILAMCITGSCSRESLVSWIRYLQESNPNLENVPVLFTLKTEGPGMVLYDSKQKQASGS